MNRFHNWYCQSDRWRRRLASEVLPWSLEGVDLGGDVLELGPGPGLTTDWLSQHCRHLTCLEVDSKLAQALRQRSDGEKVTVELGDATSMPFGDASFGTVVSFTMLHHVPSPELQNRLFAEARRVLQPGGVFAGSDGTWSVRMWFYHIADTLVPLDPGGLPQRLSAAGFDDVKVETNGGRVRFRARRA